jgi:hypothetical protein
MRTSAKHKQLSMIPDGDGKDVSNVGEIILSRIFYRMDYFHRYRMLIYRPADPSPYPGGLDYRVEMEIVTPINGQNLRKWHPLPIKGSVKLFYKLISIANELMRGITCKGKNNDFVDLDGVPVPERYTGLFQQVRKAGSLESWRLELVRSIQSVFDTWGELILASGPSFSKSRELATNHFLEHAGFSEVERDHLMASFHAQAGIDMRYNRFAHFLKIIDLPRYEILGFINAVLRCTDIKQFPRKFPVYLILDQLPSDVLHNIVRKDGSLRWTDINLEAPEEEDLAWELDHHRPIPIEILMLHPYLFIKYDPF